MKSLSKNDKSKFLNHLIDYWNWTKHPKWYPPWHHVVGRKKKTWLYICLLRTLHSRLYGTKPDISYMKAKHNKNSW